MVRPVRLELTRLLTRPLNVRVYHSAMAAAIIIIYYGFNIMQYILKNISTFDIEGVIAHF